MDYILKRFKEHFTHTPLISYIGNSDKELPFKIENLAKNYDCLTIIANESNFYTISKILCTLSSDSLELKNDTLMPSRTELFVENSFVAEILDAKYPTIIADIRLPNAHNSIYPPFFSISDIWLPSVCTSLVI